MFKLYGTELSFFPSEASFYGHWSFDGLRDRTNELSRLYRITQHRRSRSTTFAPSPLADLAD
jgi:hypothetical protein